jgi:predicted nucleotidyltransferase
MSRPDPVTSARSLVKARFPDAVQAWLAGSVTTGTATETSDLDITVLLAEGEVHRESLEHEGWPVELFVHVESSIRHFVAQDLGRRRPTMARLVALGVPLVDGEGGADIRRHCEQVLADGAGPLAPEAMEYARYALTDLLDDLRGGGPAEVVGAVAVEVWRETADLLLAAHHRWSGSGKWLVRELAALDLAEHTAYAAVLHDALRSALSGDHAPLQDQADAVLGLVGGPLWAGYRAEARL